MDKQFDSQDLSSKETILATTTTTATLSLSTSSPFKIQAQTKSDEVRAHNGNLVNKQSQSTSPRTSRTSAALGSPLSSPLKGTFPIMSTFTMPTRTPEIATESRSPYSRTSSHHDLDMAQQEDDEAVLEQIMDNDHDHEHVDVTMSGETTEIPDHEEDDGDDEEGDGDGDDGEEGEGEGEGEEGSGSEDDEDDEEDDEEDEEDSEDDRSEDLEGSPEIVAIDAPDGSIPKLLLPTVKTEPGTSGDALPSTADAEIPPTNEEGETNVLVPKKKKRIKRSPSAEEDLAPPPPPMKTIRLEKALIDPNETLEWNILEDAREKGMVEIWGVTEDLQLQPPVKLTSAPAPQEGPMEVDESTSAVAGPSTTVAPGGSAPLPLFGLGFGDEDAEEIARRLEERYGDADKKTKKKSKKKPVEIYDLEDPFIDDSEILIDAPTHFARPAKEGFFVHSGPLELMEESPVRTKARPKPKAGRVSTTAAAPKPRRPLGAVLRARSRRRVSQLARGTQVEPISIDDSDGDGEAGAQAGSSRSPSKRESLSPLPDEEEEELVNVEPEPIDPIKFKSASKDPRFLPPFAQFPKEVRARLNAMRSASNAHDWDNTPKGKFPDHLKPELQRVGEAAYQNGVFNISEKEGTDKGFTPALPSILPYNEFTLRKLVTKLCYDGLWRWLRDCEDEGIRQIKEMVDEEKASVIEKYEASLAAWKEEVKEYEEKHPQSGLNGNTTSESNHNHDPINGESTPKPDDARPVEPPKRFTWTPEMREVFGQLLDNLQEMSDLTKKAALWNISAADTSKNTTEQAMKMRLYKKITDCFPEGYMNGTIISREMQKVQRKKKQQAPEQDGE